MLVARIRWWYTCTLVYIGLSLLKEHDIMVLLGVFLVKKPTKIISQKKGISSDHIAALKIPHQVLFAHNNPGGYSNS